LFAILISLALAGNAGLESVGTPIVVPGQPAHFSIAANAYGEAPANSLALCLELPEGWEAGPGAMDLATSGKTTKRASATYTDGCWVPKHGRLRPGAYGTFAVEAVPPASVDDGRMMWRMMVDGVERAKGVWRWEVRSGEVTGRGQSLTHKPETAHRVLESLSDLYALQQLVAQFPGDKPEAEAAFLSVRFDRANRTTGQVLDVGTRDGLNVSLYAALMREELERSQTSFHNRANAWIRSSMETDQIDAVLVGLRAAREALDEEVLEQLSDYFRALPFPRLDTEQRMGVARGLMAVNTRDDDRAQGLLRLAALYESKNQADLAEDTCEEAVDAVAKADRRAISDACEAVHDHSSELVQMEPLPQGNVIFDPKTGQFIPR